jgi:hypothetical protein
MSEPNEPSDSRRSASENGSKSEAEEPQNIAEDMKEAADELASAASAIARPLGRLLHATAVYGVAGAMVLGDALGGLGRGVARGFAEANSPEASEPDTEKQNAS